MNDTRVEEDLLGSRELPAQALYGIHGLRASENFPLSLRPVPPRLVHAFGAVKLACARANHALAPWEDEVFAAIEAACEEMRRGELDGALPLDALQGGAGTSTNMAVNELLCNRALELLGEKPGNHARLSPHDDLNRHQSTNDTYPTALRVALLEALGELEHAVVELVEAFQAKERDWADVVKVARTQLQDAVLTTMGRSMGAYAETFSRDRWRLSKCFERLRVVNLGGTAIGTGLGAPRKFIFSVVDRLRTITGLGLARAENLVDATQNQDALVESSGMVRTLATSLVKVCSDLRLMASGPHAGFAELRLPARQSGSSLMPGKVNPVIPEAVLQAALYYMAADGVVAQAAMFANLELHAFLPLVADRMLDGIEVLTRAVRLLRSHCIEGLEVVRERCAATARGSTAMATALVDELGYGKVRDLARRSEQEGRPLGELVLEAGLLDEEGLDRLLRSEAVLRLGSPEKGKGVFR